MTDEAGDPPEGWTEVFRVAAPDDPPDGVPECTGCLTPSDLKPLVPTLYEGRWQLLCRDCLDRQGVV